MLVNTEKGQALVGECNELECVERPLAEAVEGNHNLSHVSERPEGRDTYFDDSVAMGIGELSAKYGLKPSLRDYLRILKQNIFMLRNK